MLLELGASENDEGTIAEVEAQAPSLEKRVRGIFNVAGPQPEHQPKHPVVGPGDEQAMRGIGALDAVPRDHVRVLNTRTESGR